MTVSIRVTLKSGGYIDPHYLHITYQSIPTTDSNIRVNNCYCNISHSPHLVYIIVVMVIVLILD